MSMWTDFTANLKSAVSTRANQEIQRKIIRPGPVQQQASMLALPPAIIAAAPRVMPAIGRVVGTAVTATTAFLAGRSLQGGGGVCPSGFHPAKDGSGRCVRNR